MTFSNQKLTQSIVLDLLREAENSFTPPLSINIPYTVDDYALKLSNNASFILCKDDKKTIGFLAYYVNKEGRFAYIAQIWVSDYYQRRGLGSSMINEMINSLPLVIDSIRLEVRKNNSKAFAFYLKSNYTIIEERESKLLMGKKIYSGNTI